MEYKSHDRLKKERNIFIGALILSVLIIVLMGMDNLSAVDSARYYQDAYEKKKARVKVLEDELYDIKTSGTCLSRISKFDKEMGLES